MAADRLFARAKSPQTLSMDAIATAAGVGKGTLFRAFGSRDGLLDALWAKKLAPLQKAFDLNQQSAGSSVSPCDRAIAFMDALVSFKLENRHLLRARELAPGLLQSEHYRWMHAVLRQLIEASAAGKSSSEAAYAAHALLATLHIDLIEELLATGISRQAIRQSQGVFVRAIIGDRNDA